MRNRNMLNIISHTGRSVRIGGLLALLAALSAGCGGVADEAPEAGGPEVVTSSMENLTVLHEFAVGEVRYRFLDTSQIGEPSVIAEQYAPLTISNPPMTQLLQNHAGLTNLEIYLALA